MTSLSVEAVAIDEHSIGLRITVLDLDRVAALIAIVLMGQVTHAATIIDQMTPATPAINVESLRAEALNAVPVPASENHRWNRDGLLLEILSWIAASESTPGCLLKDPHLKATTQGLDGLMIELDNQMTDVVRTTIFEDKCSSSPRAKFRDEILPFFQTIHAGERSTELLAAAATLLAPAGLTGTAATIATAALDPAHRAYRGGLAVDSTYDSADGRKGLFKNFEDLTDILPEQRIGASLVTSTEMRSWFDALAARTRQIIETMVPSV